MQLNRRVALITGATRGIGEAIARRLAREGATVIVNGRDQEKCRELVADLERGGAMASFVAGDVSNSDTVEAIASHVSHKHGHLDVAVLNAGVVTYGAFWEISEADFDEMMAVNVRGPWMCAKALHPLMPRGSSIILTGSISSFMPYIGESIYCASKGAAQQLMRAMALELAGRGIRVNAIAPGIVIGGGMSQDRADEAQDPQRVMNELVGPTPLQRGGTLEEMADGALFLAGRQSTFITGQSLVIDGGMLLT